MNSNTKIILLENKNYPKLLKEIYNPPLGLYIRGDASCFNANSNLAVIGSRKSTDYGKKSTEKIIKELKDSKITIVSGLALGIDSYAHKCALANNLKTIGIIGSGFNYFFPSENINLAKSIVKNGGLVVSEYPLDFKPEKYYFPARNRIISGISKGVLIIEAQERSGTLITAKFAEEQNRDIYAIPNNIFEKSSCGTNGLIKEGAKLIDSGEDIILDMSLKF
ncbi:MAG: DNA-processing protein DprA [Candidatus Pacebacteria bacterium]|nr:DNA-processing protein DprA [Candidatus Paceibacterota bacterium]